MKNKDILSKTEENLKLVIEISNSNSELIMRLEEIIKEDLTSHKLPTELKNIIKQRNDKNN